jgi:hypothetical protein
VKAVDLVHRHQQGCPKGDVCGAIIFCKAATICFHKYLLSLEDILPSKNLQDRIGVLGLLKKIQIYLLVT